MVKFTIRALKVCALLVILLTVVFVGTTLFVMIGEISRNIPNYITSALIQTALAIVIGLTTALEIYGTAVLIELMVDIHKNTQASANVLRGMYRDQTSGRSPQSASPASSDF